MGFLSGVGKIMNDVLGGTSSAKQAQKYALQQASINNAYQKEFAQNAHQWEVKDLEKAGLNPILSAGGSGANASGGGIATGPTSANGNIADLGKIAESVTSAVKNTASALRDNAETTKTIEGMEFIKPQAKANIENTIANTTLANAKKIESQATAKFQNERARGFSESTSESSDSGWNGGLNGGGGVSIKKGIHGQGGITGGHHSAKSKSHSKTW